VPFNKFMKCKKTEVRETLKKEIFEAFTAFLNVNKEMTQEKKRPAWSFGTDFVCLCTLHLL